MKQTAGLAAVLLLFASCSSDAEGDLEGPPNRDAVPSAYEAVGTLPTDYFLRSFVDLSQTRELEVVLQERFNAFFECMQEGGFDVFDTSSVVTEDLPTNPIDANASYSEQRDWVSRNGYGILAETEVGEDEPEPPPYSPSKLSQYYERRGECISNAVAKFALPGQTTRPGEDVGALATSIATDGRWLEAYSLWQPCMQAAGYSYPDRLRAVEAATEKAERGELDLPEEIRLALADLECGREVF